MCSQHSHKAVEVALPPHTRAPDLAAGMLHLPCIRNPFCDVMLCHTIYADALYYLAPHIYLYKLYILNTFNLRFCPFPSLSLVRLLALAYSVAIRILIIITIIVMMAPVFSCITNIAVRALRFWPASTSSSSA